MMSIDQAGKVATSVVESLRNPTVVRSSAALETFHIRPMALREAFVRAIDGGGASRFKTDSRFAVVDAPPCVDRSSTSRSLHRNLWPRACPILRI